MRVCKYAAEFRDLEDPVPVLQYLSGVQRHPRQRLCQWRWIYELAFRQRIYRRVYKRVYKRVYELAFRQRIYRRVYKLELKHYAIHYFY